MTSCRITGNSGLIGWGHSLQEACSHEDAPYDKSKAHRALPDCHSVLDVMRAYVKNEM